MDRILQAPQEQGTVERIVARPAEDERQTLTEGYLDAAHGLRGDRGSPKPQKQLTIMNARAAAHVAGSPENWDLAGDQLYVDFDISIPNLPPGSRLAIGD